MPSCGAHGAADDAAARQLGARWERPVQTPGPRAICGPPKKKRPANGRFFFSLAGPLFASLVLAMGFACEKKAAANGRFFFSLAGPIASLSSRSPSLVK